MNPKEIYEEFKRRVRHYAEKNLDDGCKRLVFSRNAEITLSITYIPSSSKYQTGNMIWYTIKEKGKDEIEKGRITDLDTLLYKYTSIFDPKNLKSPKEVAQERKYEDLMNKR